MNAVAVLWMLVAVALAVVDVALVAALVAHRRRAAHQIAELDEWADMMCRRAARAEKELANFKRIQTK